MIDGGGAKPIRWTPHALDNLLTRDIDRAEVVRTLEHPDRIVQGAPPRTIYLRRYLDDRRGHDMVMRVVVEDTATERVIVTVVKASRIERYLRGTTP